ncbi:multicopper oxidase [Aulographum hederae CBS 113979]|uniref:Multicopper oxidase n=1 Tax=Aulographum hederae CBS 113979 TaxID=1176131 RepID=A0A6G1GPZ3_9PEZI|nr:multicopper oxidase [Aulographum hederae CBS 113979]
MFFLLLFLAVINTSLAKTVTYNFNVGWVTAAPDGFARPVQGINGQWPIPMIEANVGDRIVVHVVNNLGNQSTSLHFHGMYQQGTAGSDGSVGVTQCPIPPGSSYTYTFIANPPGTHWYHSHDRGQYPDGLRGIMIVHDPVWEATLGVTEQIPLVFSDWYHEQMPIMLQSYLAEENVNGIFPTPVALLVNESSKPPEFNFKPGRKYLLRMVNVGAVATQSFTIQDHTMTVVGIDGIEVKPVVTSSISLNVGQRYTVIVQSKLNPLSSFRYAVKMSPDMFTGPAPASLQLTVQGVVKYVSKLLGLILDLIGSLLDTSTLSPSTTLDDFALVPRDGERLLTPVARTIHLFINQQNFPDIGSRIQLGDQPYVESEYPSLFTALTTGATAADPVTYGPGIVPFIVQYNDVIQINLTNPQPFPHPMHLHGHSFQVVARGPGLWDGGDADFPPVPMKRDVASVPAGGFVVLRFRADNPGVWLFHCHIEWHLASGMAVTFVEAPGELQRGQVVGPAGLALCAGNAEPKSKPRALGV